MTDIEQRRVVAGIVGVVVIAVVTVTVVYVYRHRVTTSVPDISASEYYRQKKYDQALTKVDSEAKKDPDNAGLYTLRGNILRDQGKASEAIEQYLKAIELDPKYLAARLNLIHVYINEGNQAEAQVQITAGLKLYPADPTLVELDKEV